MFHHILEHFWKVFTIYLIVLVIIRIMGKRALGELSAFDFVVIIGIGDILVLVDVEHKVTIIDGTVALVTLVLLEYIMSVLTFNSKLATRLIEGRPTVMIDNGKILYENLKKEKFNYSDIMQELRKQGVKDVTEVEKGIFEACGKFSVILSDDASPVSKEDLGIKPPKKPGKKPTIEMFDKPKGTETQGQTPPQNNTDQAIQDIQNAINDLNIKLNNLRSSLQK